MRPRDQSVAPFCTVPKKNGQLAGSSYPKQTLKALSAEPTEAG